MTQQEKLFIEVEPLGDQALALTSHFQDKVQPALGPERANLIDTPIEIGTDQSILYRPSSSNPGRFHEIKLIWADSGDGSMSSYRLQWREESS